MYVSPIIIVLVLGVIILVVSLFWVYGGPNSGQDPSTHFVSDLASIRELLTNDSHLHRLLMIEIVRDKLPQSPQDSSTPQTDKLNVDKINVHSSGILVRSEGVQSEISPSEAVTFSKMAAGMSLLGRALIRSFGVAIAQRIATLLHKRNEILRDYYGALRNMICQNGECFLDLNKTDDGEKITRPVFPPAFLSHEGSIPYSNHEPGARNISKISSGILDITTMTERKLEGLSREITDQVAASFHIRDVDQASSRNRPLLHFQRLFNLITMYDKELVNQAKSYAAHHYDISMNCAQSSLEITRHISDELGILMRESHERVKTVP